MSKNEQLIKKLILLRSESLNIKEFRAYVRKESSHHLGNLPPSVLVKLKAAEITEILKIGKNIITPCDKCTTFPDEGIFGNRLEHDACTYKVNKALQKGILEQIKKPSWFKPAPNLFGSEAYYKCTSCGSLWGLVEPERNFPGLWERIA